MTMKDYNFLQTKYTVNTYVNRGLTLTRGNGPFLYTDQNEAYLDFMTNYGVNIFGYNHPKLTQALHKQADKLITLHGSFINDMRAQSSEALIKKCGEPYSQVYWSNSGAESIETALKFAPLVTKRHHFLSLTNAYHGKSHGALSITHNHKYRRPFQKNLLSTTFIEFNNAQLIERSITQDTAALIIEPIQGEGGINIPDPNYLQEIKKTCTKHNILLIIDEIQSGLGRTGTFLASQQYQTTGDILCLGKGLAGGLPVGATIVTKEIGLHIPKGIQTSTFGGNPLACALALETIQLINDDILNHINKIGKILLEKIYRVKHENIIQIRGKGLMVGIEIKKNRNNIIKQLQNNHILVAPAAENVIRLLPPYIINEQHVTEFTNTFTNILTIETD